MDHELKVLVQSFFKDYLDVVEVSDSGNEFHPIFISCCRVMKTQSLSELLGQMKELAFAEPTMELHAHYDKDGMRTQDEIVTSLYKNNMIAHDLRERVIAMRDEFAQILDEDNCHVDGELRIKLAKAELLLNKIGKLLAGQTSDTGGVL